MEFTDTQKETIKQWVREGCGLAEIQRRIADEFGAAMTYMDVRFLVLDLDVDIQEDESKKVPAPQEPSPEPTEASEGEAVPFPGTEPDAASTGGVSVEVDRVVKPGAVVSGTVTFSDGVTATWMLDQLGRLGIDPSQPGYRPSAEDNEAFVKALQNEIARKGM